MMPLPTKIGRYEITGELGRGAMGVVYKATDPNIGRVVALKTMRLDVHGVQEEEMLKRFKQEAKLAGVLTHPNVVTIYDAGEDQGVFYMAMEYVEGTTLGKMLHDQRVIPAEKIVEISKHVCSGLDYAHAHQIIHRDIKPANLMMADTGFVKIMDFGVAKSSAGMTTAGQVLGTPSYMSPEQVRGRQLDGRSDIFSYGVCLYEMVTGEKPFTGNNVTTIIYKIMNEPAIPPRELDVSVHPGLSAIITKALEKDPNKRYQSGAELVRDLEHYKSFGSDAESTSKMTAQHEAMDTAKMAQKKPPVAPPAPPKVAAKPAAPAAAAVVAQVDDPTAIESTVAVGLRIGNRPPAKHAPKPAGPNKMVLGGIAAAVVVMLLLGLGIAKRMKNNRLASEQTATATQPQEQPAATNSTPQTTAANNQPAATEPAKEEEKKPSAAETSPAPTTEKKTTPKKTAAAAAATAPTSTSPAPVVNATHGSLIVTSMPTGAKVFIGGATQSNWVTPFTADKLSPGNYELTFSKIGYENQKRNVTVSPGKAVSVGVELPEASAKIVVASTPSGGEIYLDGKNTGKITPSTLTVNRGSHEIEVRKEGFQAANTSTRLEGGDTYNFAPALQAGKPQSGESQGGGNPFRALRGLFGGGIPRDKGMLVLKTTPEGAEVVHNGQVAGKLTPIRFPMDPGTYKITVRKEGFKHETREFTIVKGKATDLNIVLSPK